MFLNPENFVSALSFLGLFIFTFLVARWVISIISPFSINEEITKNKNVALAISLSGYFIGMTAVFIGVYDRPFSGEWMDDIQHIGGYSLLGVILLNISQFINDKLILYQFSNHKKIIEDRNLGTGIVQAASYIASGLVIGGALNSPGGNIITSLAFFVFGQACLVLFSLLYEWLTPYSVHREIEEKNTAAGLGFSGGFISIGIIVMKGVSGEFLSWSDNLSLLAFNVEIIFIYLIFVRFFFDKIIIPHVDLNKQISVEKNTGAGLLEFIISVSFSLVLFYIINH
ncbi:DUF350 domain-containing protein [Flexithrix dorotheae]|uniref:DUF350 domain-containing protein n=1 Tax=Flexithrix dorotheae TaxID=70993 RepID=UPI00035D759E|nr:DUF350 domain-containing protein [Flexithrix dorotheae]